MSGCLHLGEHAGPPRRAQGGVVGKNLGDRHAILRTGRTE